MTIKTLGKYVTDYFKQGFLINRLMTLYSLLIVSFFTLAAIGLSSYSISNTYKRVDTEAQMRLEDTLSKLQSQNYITLRVLEQLVGRSEDYRNLYQYMMLTPNQYFSKVFEDWEKGKDTVLFSEEVRRLFDLYPDLISISLLLDDSSAYLYADKAIKTGRLLYGKPDKLRGNFLVRSIRNPESGDVTGRLYLTFNEPTTVIRPQENHYLASFAFDYYGRKLFRQGGKGFPHLEADMRQAIKAEQAIDLSSLNKAYKIQYNRSGDLLAYVAIKKSYLLLEAVRTVLMYSCCSLLLAWLLLQLLFRVFRNYIKQVSEITDTIEMVAAGDLSLTIDNSHMELELYHISEAINQMLASIKAYIDEVYVLEVEQRNAQMRALQSQINPHFLYNTLEYIRMYALSCQQEELADVIYAFASLLRNNISQDKMTTLKEELAFCEKYIYLYQMRYPDSFAYHVKIDESLANIEIPKFVIQPLVENYFVHGIDYNRHDNALSIKALDETDHFLIQILDNGRGISQERLLALEKNLQEQKTTGNSSIGLQNVYLRLFHHFRDRVSWSMAEGSTGGFIIQIRIRKDT
ncbi:UNVERIFIED_CONTAM: sensor histidine kinase [Streptococcus canis]|uniref:sensor histidine kinase n=1 Tax=Streptococcus canis TaxID=1329 RepID=UPI0013D94CF2|nr:sensor histidine kinase [Streptococcus canis]QKG75090.1 sensor histidine kinase [Streptococcus canis]GMX36664.1 sensor histidine kinase [Streptococcus canis]GMX40294.1 sensor histidine kinase [Streptococcus canis]